MKRQILFTLLLIGLAVGSVLLLFHNSHQPNTKSNGFVRNYNEHEPKLLFKIKVNYKIKNFVGSTNSSFFVAPFDSLVLFQYTKAGKMIARYPMRYPKIIHHAVFHIDSPDVYLLDGDGKFIFHKNIIGQEFVGMPVPGEVFTKSLLIGPGKFVLRQFLERIKDQELVCYDIKAKTMIKGIGLTELFYDSGMAEEGKLYYDKKSHVVIYVFNKKNKYLLLDTNLKLLSSGNTIDTVTLPFEKVTSYKNKEKQLSTNNTPTLIYNKVSGVSNGILYNFSKLMADNEKEHDFSSFCNIDRYDLKQSKYLGSFYLPKYDGQEIKSLMIDGDILLVCYSDHIAAFNIN